MACPVCIHPNHEALLVALPTQSFRTLEAQYGISRSVLQRHRARGCPDVQREATRDANGDLAQVITLLEEIRGLLVTLVAQSPRAPDRNGTTHHEGERPVWNRL